MKESSRKHEDIEQFELDALKEIREKLFERGGNKNKNCILKGLLLGLTYGVGGTLFVQFLVPLAEAFLIGEYSLGQIFNFIVCAISLFLIIGASLYLRRQIARDNNESRISKESEEIIEYAIGRRQYNLEKRKEATT